MAVTVVAGLAAGGGASIAAGAFVLSTFTQAFVLGAGLSLVSRALTPKPNLTTPTGLTSSSVSEIQERPLIYGRTRTGGNIPYFTNSGADSKFLHLVVAFAGHPIDGYEKIHFGDEVIWENGSFVGNGVTMFRLIL